jgi:hypothetical protein
MMALAMIRPFRCQRCGKRHYAFFWRPFRGKKKTPKK